jgi:hypothetical protein
LLDGIVVPLIDVAVATPRTGVTSVGVLANTKEPVPVSSEITPANSADVVAACTDNLSVVTTRVLDVGIVVELTVKPLTFDTVAPDAIVVEPRVGAVYVAVVDITFQELPDHAYIRLPVEFQYVAPVIKALP